MTENRKQAAFTQTRSMEVRSSQVTAGDLAAFVADLPPDRPVRMRYSPAYDQREQSMLRLEVDL